MEAYTAYRKWYFQLLSRYSSKNSRPAYFRHIFSPHTKTEAKKWLLVFCTN